MTNREVAEIYGPGWKRMLRKAYPMVRLLELRSIYKLKIKESLQ